MCDAWIEGASWVLSPEASCPGTSMPNCAKGWFVQVGTGWARE